MKNNFLHALLKPILKKNLPFKDKFKDQTCYIFGNGASLKAMDLKHFTDHPTIAINHLVLHKDFHLLDTCCYALIEPLSFYSYFKNPYTQKYQSNVMGRLFKKEIAKFPHLNLFTSFTNIFGSPLQRTYYLHHFGKRQADSKHLDLCSDFSYLAGGLHAGIGLAIELGFKKAILVGCDYLTKPRTFGHFYAQPLHGKDDDYQPYTQLLEDCSSKIALEVITDHPRDCVLPSIDYENFTGSPVKYRENVEIVSRENLLILNKAFEMEQYTSPVLPLDYSMEVKINNEN